MIRITRTIHVQAPLKQVYGFLSDFSNLTEWDPSVRQARKSTPGAVGEGSRFEIEIGTVLGSIPMTYEVTAHEPPHMLELRGRGERFETLDRIRLEKMGDGTRIDYHLAVHLDHQTRPMIRRCLALWIRGNADRALKRLAAAFDSPSRPPVINSGTRLADTWILPGLVGFTRFGYHWRRKRWHPLAADLSGRTIVVTGATSGIGKAAAHRLARLGGRVVMVGRNPDALHNTAASIRRQTGNTQVFWEAADLSRLAQVRDLAGRLAALDGGIQVLVNNAGALFRQRTQTPEGHEASLATNLLGPFLLTNLMIPVLSAQATSRIITVSSGGMYPQPLDIDTLAIPGSPYNGVQAYALAKRAQVVLTRLWARMLKRQGVSAHAMHPGWVDTPGIAASLPGFHRLTRHFLRSPEQGADTIVWLAAAAEAQIGNGGFWLDRALHPIHILRRTRESESARRALWRYLCRETGWEGPEPWETASIR